MKGTEGISLNNVQEVYSGPEGDLWEMIMGEQIHIGGFSSSMALAEKAGVGKGMNGIDLCCCNGAGMRFLVRFREVAAMQGVDATEKVILRGRQRCEVEGLHNKITFHLKNVCNSGLSSNSADFVWGEDAWCYVEDKTTLIAEAVRLTKSGGAIAFTDWVEGPKGLSAQEAERFLQFMKFPNVQDIAGYTALLQSNGCTIQCAEDTGLFAPYVDLYINMLTMQLTYDALKIIGFNAEVMQFLAGEMKFMQELAHAGKIAQGRFVAKKR